MPLELGQVDAQIKQDRITWRFQSTPALNGKINSDPTLEIFRGLLETIGDRTIFTEDKEPILVKSSETASLIPYLDSPELQALFTPEQLAVIIPALPLILTACFDAADKKAIAEKAAQEKLKQAPNSETETPQPEAPQG